MDTRTPTTAALDLLDMTLKAARHAVEAGDRDAAIKHFDDLSRIASDTQCQLSPLRPSATVCHQRKPVGNPPYPDA